MKRTISIRQIIDIQSCNVCGVATYESKYNDVKHVNHVNEITIAGFAINLCDECYNELIAKMVKFEKLK